MAVRKEYLALLLLLMMMMLSFQAARGASIPKRTRAAKVSAASGNGNAVVDNVLTNLKEKKSAELEPYYLPNSTLGTWYKMVVNFTGEIFLHDGYVTGITTIRRTGDTGMELRNGKIHIDARLGIGRLFVRYLADVTLMGYGPTITILAEVDWADIDMDLVMVKGKPHLHDLTLYELEGFTVKIQGLGPLNFMFNTWSGLITSYVKGPVRKAMEFALRKGLEEVLKDIV